MLVKGAPSKWKIIANSSFIHPNYAAESGKSKHDSLALPSDFYILRSNPLFILFNMHVPVYKRTELGEWCLHNSLDIIMRPV